jgi:hypothetical protein
MIETGSKGGLKDLKMGIEKVFDVAETITHQKLTKAEYEKARLQATKDNASINELANLEKSYKLQKRAQLLGFLKNIIGLKK